MNRFLFPFILNLLFGTGLLAARGGGCTADTLAGETGADTLRPVQTSIWPALIRSAIVPGWGQIQQEHPGRGIIYYGTGMYLMYHIILNARQYEKTAKNSYRQQSQRYAILYAQVYLMNLLDVAHSHVTHQDQLWPQKMFSDIPLKSPWGAVTRSAMLPGWGQLYNEKYIKAVIAFGICFDFTRKVYLYNQWYQHSGKKYYRERRVVNSWYLGLFYMLNMVDAYVDAYLYKFDQMMNLTVDYSTPHNVLLLGVHLEF